MARTTTSTRKTAAKKTTARKPAARKTRATVIDLRHPLPVRRRNFVGPHTSAQITEARATLASAMARLPVPSILWLTQPDGRAYAKLPNGTLLIHTHPTNPEFDAYIPCRHGALHQHLVTTARDLAELPRFFDADAPGWASALRGEHLSGDAIGEFVSVHSAHLPAPLP